MLFSYETDKASFEEEAQEAGVLLEIFYEADEEVGSDSGSSDRRTRRRLFRVVTGKHADRSAQVAETAPAEAAEPAAETAEAAPVPAAAPQTGRLKISPRAKIWPLAASRCRYAVPTGPEGRVIERDIRTLMETGPKVTAAAKLNTFALDGQVIGTGIGGRIRQETL